MIAQLAAAITIALIGLIATGVALDYWFGWRIDRAIETAFDRHDDETLTVPAPDVRTVYAQTLAAVPAAADVVPAELDQPYYFHDDGRFCLLRDGRWRFTKGDTVARCKRKHAS